MEQPGPSDAAAEPEAAAVEDLQDISEIQRNRDDEVIPVELNDL